MQHPASTRASWRDLTLFALGPGLLTVAIAGLFFVHPWPVPYAVQAKSYDPLFFGPVLVLGGLGVWLSPRIGAASAPSFRDGQAWLWLLAVAVLTGLAFTGVSAILDLEFNLSRVAAQAIGQRSINVPFPASIAHYTFGAVIEECMGRLIPIPILAWLIGSLMLRGRRGTLVFWIVAALASLPEPLGQALPLASRAPALALITVGVEYPGTLILVWLFRRFGWPVLIVTRLVQELSWHVLWPLLAPV